MKFDRENLARAAIETLAEEEMTAARIRRDIRHRDEHGRRSASDPVRAEV